jgi:hypothetical protein
MSSPSQSNSTLVIPAESANNILDYLFMFAYPAAFLGAIFFSINSFMNLQPMTTFANNQVVMVLNIYLAIAGFFALLVWLKPAKLGFLSTAINGLSNSLGSVYNINTIKTSSNS